ncbi:MAG: hypothetical protein Ta2G_00970 [Termitinemataceae bacterium]|nr:MAG: hypothetical protein Ta2G_00970 [Termitinemataceae bacterium]
MAETRYTVRYFSDAYVQLTGLKDHEFRIIDISTNGCCLESNEDAHLQKRHTYDIRIVPGAQADMNPFIINAMMYWTREANNIFQYGFKVRRKASDNSFEKYLEYCKNSYYGKIKSKILKIVLITALSAVLLMSITCFFSILNLRSIVETESLELGNSAAREGANALEKQAKLALVNLVQDKASLTNEKLSEIQNQTKMVADIATNIYSNPASYKPREIDYLHEDEIGKSVAHVRTAPGVNFAANRNEIYLAANITDMLRQITITDNEVSSSYIGTESGFFISVQAEAPGPARRMDYDARERPWYIGAKEKDGLYWSPLFEDASGMGVAISCAMPFFDNSGGRHVLKGVAASGTILSENISKIIDSTKIAESGFAFIINNLGQSISKSWNVEYTVDEDGSIKGNDLLNSENPDLKKLAEEMVAGRSGLIEANIDEKFVFVAYEPLLIEGWGIAVVVPVLEVINASSSIRLKVNEFEEKEISKINTSIFALILAVIIVIIITSMAIIFVSTKLSESITAPITALCEGARIIGSGNINFKLRVKSGDEIEMLAEAFDLMVRNINQISNERDKIGSELDVAAQIQTNMLPSVEPAFSGLKEFELFAEARTAKQVGGDFYDFYKIDPDHIALVIADVSGKGVPAALFMVVVKTLLKDQAFTGSTLEAVFYSVNNRLCENNEASLFVSVFMGILDLTTGDFSYINAGHNPPLIKQKNSIDSKHFRWLEDRSGLVLGVLEGSKYKSYETKLEKDDIILLYTDGVNEAMNRNSQEYGNKRFIETLNKEIDKNAPVESYVKSVLDSVLEFEEGAEHSDDITMLMMHVKDLNLKAARPTRKKIK